jgi:hypothetical protein
MKHAKHTPGPWVIEQTETDNIILQGEDSDQIATCDRAFGDANARLIAAAPELLVWSQDLLARLLAQDKLMNAMDRHTAESIRMLGKAIAKAIGVDE